MEINNKNSVLSRSVTNLHIDIQSMFAEHHSRVLSERAKQVWKLRKEKLAKLKTPASTSVSKKTK